MQTLSGKEAQRHTGRPDLTIVEWKKNVFKNKIVNIVRELFLGFTVWEIWKTPNLRIFKNK